MTTLRPRPNGYPIKLVRDRTAAIINATGEPGDLWYAELLDADERMAWLRKKLVEEVAEYVVDGGDDELADVYAVVLALEDLHGCTLTTMLHSDVRGGFFEGVMMYGRHDEFDVGPMPRAANSHSRPEADS